MDLVVSVRNHMCWETICKHFSASLPCIWVSVHVQIIGVQNPTKNAIKHSALVLMEPYPHQRCLIEFLEPFFPLKTFILRYFTNESGSHRSCDASALFHQRRTQTWGWFQSKPLFADKKEVQNVQLIAKRKSICVICLQWKDRSSCYLIDEMLYTRLTVINTVLRCHFKSCKCSALEYALWHLHCYLLGIKSSSCLKHLYWGKNVK